MGRRLDSLKSNLKKIEWRRIFLFVYIPVSIITLLGTILQFMKKIGFVVLMNQRRFIYHSYAPNNSRTHVHHPKDIPGLNNVAFIEETWIKMPRENDIRLHSYLLLRKDSDPKTFPTMMWCHSTGGNIVINFHNLIHHYLGSSTKGSQ